MSHQHGVGLDHRDALAVEKGPAGTAVLAAAFGALDPDGRMNPGKLLPMTALTWDASWRARTLAGLDQPWDLVVVGGGIAGAGVLRAASRAGLRALLLEQSDFAWGASSRSSQLVHGGLRYLAKGQLRSAARAVGQRESLLREAPGLVEPLPFVVPLRRGERRRRLGYRATIGLYEVLGGRAPSRVVSPPELALRAPTVQRTGVTGALSYGEGRTDDARLVLRVLREGVAAGGTALNAVEVTGLVHRAGRVAGVQVRDRLTGESGSLSAAVVVNATGAWSDRLRRDVGGSARMRPLRGSHLLFPAWRFPLHLGVNVRSPRDGRHVSVLPWQGATLVGTTDLDHDGDLAEPGISPDEVTYLLECVTSGFPSLELTAADVLSTWSGVRPVVSSGAAASGDERREHVVWDEQGLLTATGAKLTTFQVLADDVLAAVLPLARSTPAPPPPVRRAREPARRPVRRRGRRAGRDGPARRAGARRGHRHHLGRAALVGPPGGRHLARRPAAAPDPPRAAAARRGRATSWTTCAPCAGTSWAGTLPGGTGERAAYAALVRDRYAVPPGTSTVSPAGTTSTVTGSGPTGSPSA